MSTTIEQKEYYYFGHFHDPSTCYLQIFKNNDNGHHIIVVTEMPDNKGTSVTNAIETLAQNITSEYDINDFTWIEHYTSHSFNREEDTFDEATFEGENYTRPKWERTSLEKVKELIHADEEQIDPEPIKEVNDAISELEL